MYRQIQEVDDVVITGYGAVTSLGVGSNSFQEALYTPPVNFSPVEALLAKNFSCKIGAIIQDFHLERYLPRKGLKTLSRAAQFACVSTHYALERAGLNISSCDPSRIAVVLGTAFGSIESVFEFDFEAANEGKRYVDAMSFPNTVTNAPAGYVGALWGITGVNATICTGMTSGIDCVTYGVQLLREKRADIVIAGGYEQFSPLVWGAFEAEGYLKKNSSSFLSPFDQRSVGTFLGEGAAIVVLEREQESVRSGRVPLAHLSRIGTVRLSNSMTTNNLADLLSGLIQGTLENESDHVALIAAANGSAQFDQMEAHAIDRALGPDGMITAPKSILGECLGAGGALNLVVGLCALSRNVLPGTPGYDKSKSLLGSRVIDENMKCISSGILVEAIDRSTRASTIFLEKAS